MSEPKYREWILETIDSLRSRKARPDLERICRMVRRRHGSDPDRTRTELEKLIQEQTVLKVSYKGSISYRNAAKVQRKSRKKSEFTPVGGGGGGAEAARERTKHNNLNNNGDSAHSFTDPEEGEQESEPSPDPQPQTASTAGEKQKPPSSPSSGNDCLSCGATTGCAAGSGCREEKASASRDEGFLGHQAGGHGTSAHDGVDAGGATPSKANAIRGGTEPGLSGAKEGSGVAADMMEKKTCPGSAGSSDNSLPPKQKPTAPKLRVGGGGGPKAAGDRADSDLLGDRLVASVRSLSEVNLVRGGSSAVACGQTKPLGLKEILGYLSGQERLSEEKLTRGKVKAVLEREVARGRLRKTRCGNIALPARGMVEEPMAKNAPAARLLESSPQDGHVAEKEDEDEPMETDSGEDNQEENEEEEEEDPQSSDEEGGPSSPVVMETEPGPDNITAGSQIQAAVRQESPQHQHHCGKGVSGASSLTRTACPSAQGGGLSGYKSTQLKESTVTKEDHMHMDAQDQMGLQCERRSHTSPGFKSSECKTEVGVSSCLLTPTASPKDSGQSEERGMNGGVIGGLYVKCEDVSVSPVDWTVSDVVSYFTAAGFPEQAVAFRTQEIDGKSLLLMQRNDVLTGLSIRLGPALKIYERHVKVLQKTHFEDDDC